MERLWSPWRHAYIAAAGADMTEGAGCILCEVQKNPADDEKNFLVHRAGHNFVILNLYPYISGHLMIAPYDHLGDFESAPKDTTDEMMDLAKRCQSALREVYHPHGFNIGMRIHRLRRFHKFRTSQQKGTRGTEQKSGESLLAPFRLIVFL